MSKIDFRPYVPYLGESKIAGETARAHAKSICEKDLIKGLFENWNSLFVQPFNGITTNGLCQKKLFFLKLESAPTATAFNASTALLSILSQGQKRQATVKNLI